MFEKIVGKAISMTAKETKRKTQSKKSERFLLSLVFIVIINYNVTVIKTQAQSKTSPSTPTLISLCFLQFNSQLSMIDGALPRRKMC